MAQIIPFLPNASKKFFTSRSLDFCRKGTRKNLPSWHLTLVYDSKWNSEQRTEEWDVTKRAPSPTLHAKFQHEDSQARRFIFACTPKRQVPLLGRDPRALLCSLFSDQETVFLVCFVCFCFVFVWRFLLVVVVLFLKWKHFLAKQEWKKSICQSFQWLECLLLPICNNC